MIDYTKRGTPVRALRVLSDPGGHPAVVPGQTGIVKYEILENENNKHMLYVTRSSKQAFLVRPDEIGIDVWQK